MNAIIFYEIAEYCDSASKLTIKQNDREVRIEIWNSNCKDISVETRDFLSPQKAYRAYKIAIGNAINGGWKVLNSNPQRETWETKRSK